METAPLAFSCLFTNYKPLPAQSPPRPSVASLPSWPGEGGGCSAWVAHARLWKPRLSPSAITRLIQLPNASRFSTFASFFSHLCSQLISEGQCLGQVLLGYFYSFGCFQFYHYLRLRTHFNFLSLLRCYKKFAHLKILNELDKT